MRVHTHCAGVHSLSAAAEAAPDMEQMHRAAASAAVAHGRPAADNRSDGPARRRAQEVQEEEEEQAGAQEVQEESEQAPRPAPALTPRALFRGPLASSGGGIRTRDLRVMSPTSYQTAPPRVGRRKFNAGFTETASSGPHYLVVSSANTDLLNRQAQGSARRPGDPKVPGANCRISA
jgi:hypothetical protein